MKNRYKLLNSTSATVIAFTAYIFIDDFVWLLILAYMSATASIYLILKHQR